MFTKKIKGSEIAAQQWWDYIIKYCQKLTRICEDPFFSDSTRKSKKCLAAAEMAACAAM